MQRYNADDNNCNDGMFLKLSLFLYKLRCENEPYMIYPNIYVMLLVLALRMFALSCFEIFVRGLESSDFI